MDQKLIQRGTVWYVIDGTCAKRMIIIYDFYLNILILFYYISYTLTHK